MAEEIRSRAQLPPQLPPRLSLVADAALSASPTAPPARRPRECGRSGGPGEAGAAVGHGGGRGSPTALVVLRLSGGPRPFGPASFAVCPFGFLPVSYWVLPLIPIACRNCLYLQGVGPSSLPYGAVWLAGCLGGAQPEARGQDTGHSHHNPGAVQTSGLSSAGGAWLPAVYTDCQGGTGVLAGGRRPRMSARVSPHACSWVTVLTCALLGV